MPSIPFIRSRGAAAALLFVSLAAIAPLARVEAARPEPASSSASTLPVLGPAPAWSLTDLEGKPVGAETLKGKVVVVDFWATWCGPCVHEIPGYVALQKKYAEKGLVIVGVSVDQRGEAAVKPFAKKMNINYPLAMATPEIVAAFGDLQSIPTTFLIDREGKIRHRKMGAMDSEAYEKLLVPLL